MELTIFGATGRIGGHLVRQALHAGHGVRAVVRDTSTFGAPGVGVVRVGSLDDLDAVLPALRGADAALSAIGARSRKDGPVASTATRGILNALTEAGVDRFLAVSAVPVGPIPEGESFLNRRIALPIIGALLRDLYADLAEMEREIAATPLDWTAVRPPKLDDRPLGAYRTAIGGNVPRAFAVSRADVAHAMLAAVDDPRTFRQALGVAR